MRRHTTTLVLTGSLTLLAACGGIGEPPSESTSAPPTMTSEPAGLTGTWDYVLDEAGRDEVLATFGGYVSADEAVTRIAFDGNDWWQGFVFDGELLLRDGLPAGDAGTFAVNEDLIVMTGAHGEARVTYEWTIEGDSLSLTAVEECALSGSEMTCRDDQADMDPVMLLVTDQTFTRSGDDPSY